MQKQMHRKNMLPANLGTVHIGPSTSRPIIDRKCRRITNASENPTVWKVKNISEKRHWLRALDGKHFTENIWQESQSTKKFFRRKNATAENILKRDANPRQHTVFVLAWSSCSANKETETWKCRIRILRIITCEEKNPWKVNQQKNKSGEKSRQRKTN